VINDHEPMIPSGEGQIAETSKRKPAPAFRRQSTIPMPTVWPRTAGELLSGLLDWRHASVAVLLPGGCHGVCLTSSTVALLAYPRGVCSGMWSNVSGTFETRYDHR
jgi:hypothetical protein